MKKRISIGIVMLSLMLSACGNKIVEEVAVPTPTPEPELIISGDRTEATPLSLSEEDVTPRATIVMVGDVLLHDRVEKSSKTEDGYDFSPLFTHVKSEIESADLAIVNQEVIIGGEDLGISGYPAFNAPFAVADELVKTGFDVICHGTNHALDKGGKGINNCLEYWNEYPEVDVIGIHDSNDDQEEIAIRDVNGIKIAVLNYTYGTNGIEMPADMPYAVDMLKEERVRSDLSRAKEMADFVIVCPHWGEEYRLKTNEYQKKWAKIFYEGGADLIIGTHPHVIEPMELYKEDDGREMLIYYSIGNYVNWTSGTGEGVSNRMLGGMAHVSIVKNEDTVSIESYDVDAIVSHVTEGEGGVTTYFLRDYSEELAGENAIISQAPDFSYDYLVNLADSIWEDNWE